MCVIWLPPFSPSLFYISIPCPIRYMHIHSFVARAFDSGRQRDRRRRRESTEFWAHCPQARLLESGKNGVPATRQSYLLLPLFCFVFFRFFSLQPTLFSSFSHAILRSMFRSRLWLCVLFIHVLRFTFSSSSYSRVRIAVEPQGQSHRRRRRDLPALPRVDQARAARRLRRKTETSPRAALRKGEPFIRVVRMPLRNVCVQVAILCVFIPLPYILLIVRMRHCVSFFVCATAFLFCSVFLLFHSRLPIHNSRTF